LPAKIAGPVLRAGLTEALVTGIAMRTMRVKVRPIASGAKPAGAPADVASRTSAAGRVRADAGGESGAARPHSRAISAIGS
jgi:hypothetical protein